MMKIAVFLAVVAVATAAPGAIFTAGVLPASTGPLTYAAPAHVIAAPAYTVAHATPVVHAAPAVVAAPVAYTGVKVHHTVEPVEQHGYQIAY